MIQFTRKLAIVLWSCIPWPPVNAEVLPENVSITVITSDQRPITGTKSLIIVASDNTNNLTILNLDAVSAFEKQLSAELPNNSALAQQELKDRINQKGQLTLETEIRKSYQAILLSLELGINRYPAIIFDNQSVIYGVTDLTTALKIYRKWFNSQQEHSHD